MVTSLQQISVIPPNGTTKNKAKSTGHIELQQLE